MIDPPVRRLVAITRNYYREHGLSATLAKIVARAARQVSGTDHRVVDAPGQESECVPFEHDALEALGPLCPQLTVVQELHSDLEQIERIELLLATYARRNSNLNEAIVVDSTGAVLCRETFSSRSVQDNRFHVVLRTPISMRRGSERLFLILRAVRGSASSGIAAWRMTKAAGRLWVGGALRSTRIQELVAGLAEGHALKPLPGSLVYRIVGRRATTGPRYRQPDWPPDYDARFDAPRVIVVSGSESINGVARPDVAFLSDATLALQRGEADVCLLDGVAMDDALRGLLKQAHGAHVPTVYVVRDPEQLSRRPVSLARSKHSVAGFNAADDQAFACIQAMTACAFVAGGDEALELAARYRKRVIRTPTDPFSSPGGRESLGKEALVAYRRLQRPTVSVVTILYRKSEELPAVLESYQRQTYDGPIELVFVDDLSPDDSVAVVQRWEESRAARGAGPDISVRIIRNERNSGNCISRNRGLETASGDILIVVDADCMLGRNFIRSHVEAHAFGDCEAVVGPMNIETGDRPPLEVLEEYEHDPGRALAVAALQDRVNRASFLNCITRNFSIKRQAISGPLFDPAFSYSADPASGFGWEDVEMGYRLYLDGARIKFVEEAVSVHVSPASAGHDASKPARSLRNFRLLFEKHPDLAYVSRKWARETLANISRWADEAGANLGAELEAVQSTLRGDRPRAPTLARARPYRVLTYRWHVPHQYELYKLPFEFTLLTGLGSPMTESWEFGQRPMPPNARFAHADSIDPAAYDFAILHFDENVLAPENTNGVIGQDWGAAFRWLRENVDIPKVAICHGTPQFRGMYNFDYRGADLMHVIEPARRQLVDYLGDIPVVCNSHQANAEWQFRNSRVIWHGFDPAEFPPATYERGIVSPLGPLVMSRPHYRGYFLYREVFDGHFEELRPETLRVPEPHVAYQGNTYAAAKYQNYVDELRRYTVYFNPTLLSPMPRARTEPMMCGVVPVSARNHDVDMFIENGVNGFYGESADELREQLRFLLRNPEEARRIGARARATAMDVFNYERFLSDWERLVAEAVG